MKHQNYDMNIGVRTVPDSAQSPKDYTHVDELIILKKRDKEPYIFKVEIIDDDEWEPDLDFFVELYDPNTMQRLPGDDTRTKVTILDEDFPGTIGFQQTDYQVSKNQEKLDILVVRRDGADGNICCMIETEPLHDT